MIASAHVLLVAPNPRVAAGFSASLAAAGLRVTLVTSFAAARRSLESLPDLLISELRLREYNGLHLALRAHARGIKSIVVGESDAVNRREAAGVGAAYLQDDCDATRLRDAVHAAGVATSPAPGQTTHAA